MFNKLSKTNQLKLYQLIRIAEEYVKYGKKEIYNCIPDNDVRIPLYIRLSIFSRGLTRIETVSGLLKKFEDNPEIEDCIGILLRAGLMDTLNILYIEKHHRKVKPPMPTTIVTVQPSKTKEELKYLEVTKSLLADHIYSEFAYLKERKDLGLLDPKDYIKLLDNFKKKEPEFFKEEPFNYELPTHNIKADRLPPISKIVRELRASEDKRMQFDANNISELYMIYSKYEHFGLFSNEFQNMPMDLLFANIMVAIDYLLFGTWLCSLQIAHSYSDLPGAKDFEKSAIELGKIREEFLRISKIGS